MPSLDVIILTNTANDEIYKMTSKAIDSLRKSSNENSFNIILVESNNNFDKTYNVDVFLNPKEEFNYNTYLNIASEHCICDYSCVSNNDVVFFPSWWENLRDNMIKHNLDTASPKSPTEQIGIVPKYEIKHRYTPNSKIVEGYMVVYTFCGWCWVMTKNVREWLFPLDEQFKFFYQDNDIIMRLQEKNCRHALVASSHVTHFGQTSHKLLHEKGVWYNYTFGLEQAFRNKWKV